MFGDFPVVSNYDKLFAQFLVSRSRLIQSAGNHRKECHRFWLRLRHTVILISSDRTPASKKINRMALIRTLTVFSISFERKKEELYGFRQTVIDMVGFMSFF